MSFIQEQRKVLSAEARRILGESDTKKDAALEKDKGHGVEIDWIMDHLVVCGKKSGFVYGYHTEVQKARNQEKALNSELKK